MNDITKIFGTLLVMLLALTGGVMAADTSVQSQAGGITPSFSMSMPSGGVADMTLSIGTILLDGPSITVTSNTPYTISGKDNAGTKTSPGKMQAFTTSPPAWGTIALTNAFQLGFNGNPYITLTAADQTIHTGTIGEFTAPLKYKQTVLVTDPTLPATQRYRVDLTITGAATP